MKSKRDHSNGMQNRYSNQDTNFGGPRAGSLNLKGIVWATCTHNGNQRLEVYTPAEISISTVVRLRFMTDPIALAADCRSSSSNTPLKVYVCSPDFNLHKRLICGSPTKDSEPSTPVCHPARRRLHTTQSSQSSGRPLGKQL